MSCHSSPAPSSRTQTSTGRDGRPARCGSPGPGRPDGRRSCSCPRPRPPTSPCGSSLPGSARAPRRATLPHLAVAPAAGRSSLTARPCGLTRARARGIPPVRGPDARSRRGRPHGSDGRPPVPVGRRAGPPSSFGPPVALRPGAALCPGLSWAPRVRPPGSLSSSRPSRFWYAPGAPRRLAWCFQTDRTATGRTGRSWPDRDWPDRGCADPVRLDVPSPVCRRALARLDLLPDAGRPRPDGWPGRARRSGREGRWGIGRFYVGGDSRDAVAGGRTDQRRGRRHVPGGPAGSAEPARRSRRRSRSAGDEADRPRNRGRRRRKRRDPLEPELGGGLRHEKSRRRPTLPGGLPPSTIGAGGLNCRVRNGNGCFPAAMATGNRALGRLTCLRRSKTGAAPGCVTAAPERSKASTSTSRSPSPRPISTGRLNALLHLHLRPINVVV